MTVADAGAAPAAELELVAIDAGVREYELRAAGTVIARLTAEDRQSSLWLARTDAGGWRFASVGRLRPHVVVTDAGSGEQVASLRTRGVTGVRGAAQVGDRELSYKAEGAMADRWVLRDGDDELVRVARGRGERYRLTRADAIARDGLLVIIACYGALQNSAGAAASAAI